jgi:hypothetical protein
MKRSLTARTALCALRDGCAVLAAGAAVLALGACAGGGADYAPVVDGPRSEAYQADLQACQALARERALMNAETRTDMAIGAGIGALAGLADDDVTDTEGALAGALVGGNGRRDQRCARNARRTPSDGCGLLASTRASRHRLITDAALEGEFAASSSRAL